MRRRSPLVRLSDERAAAAHDVERSLTLMGGVIAISEPRRYSSQPVVFVAQPRAAKNKEGALGHHAERAGISLVFFLLRQGRLRAYVTCLQSRCFVRQPPALPSSLYLSARHSRQPARRGRYYTRLLYPLPQLIESERLSSRKFKHFNIFQRCRLAKLNLTIRSRVKDPLESNVIPFDRNTVILN